MKRLRPKFGNKKKKSCIRWGNGRLAGRVEICENTLNICYRRRVAFSGPKKKRHFDTVNWKDGASTCLTVLFKNTYTRIFIGLRSSPKFYLELGHTSICGLEVKKNNTRILCQGRFKDCLPSQRMANWEIFSLLRTDLLKLRDLLLCFRGVKWLSSCFLNFFLFCAKTKKRWNF